MEINKNGQPLFKNTKLHYLYRDADNYKISTSVIVQGTLTEEQKAKIIECLDEGEYMIPSQIGLPDPRFEKETEADHPWYELKKENIEATNQEPNMDMTVEELYNNFLECDGKWDENYSENLN